MDSKQFKKVYEYLGNDKFFYILVKKNNQSVMTENKRKLIDEIEKLEPNKDFLHVNVNITKSGCFSFQNIPVKNKANSFILKQRVLDYVCTNININVDRLLFEKDILLFPIQRIKSQEERKKVNLANRSYNLKVKEITFATTKTPRVLVEWASNNKKKLEKESTKYERALYYKLKKTFKERIKVQNPFLIKGKLYYADISIPSLKLIIEVDGGYHSTPEQKNKDKQRDEAFKSIGYTTLRFTNEQVASKDGKKKILEEILTYKNNRL